MTGISGKQGKELILSILEELRNMDPRIVPFDSDEIQALEYGVAEGVRDVFGSGSPEYSEFEGFRIAAGNISRGDSRSEKQSKYEMGLPKAVKRLEDLLSLIEQSETHARDLQAQDAAKAGAPKKEPPKRPAPPKPVPRVKAREAAPGPEPAPVPDPAPKEPPGAAARETHKEAPKEAPREAPPKRAAAPVSDQPGKVLLLQEGGDGLREAVTALLEKVGIGLALLDDDSTTEMEGIIALKDIAFAIMTVSSEPRGGLSGLTSVIGKPNPRHETAFKLGLLVGIMGPGKMLILHSGERPQDIPEHLFGIRYLPYKEEGGWQIGLLKLLKANGFFIDANLLFD